MNKEVPSIKTRSIISLISLVFQSGYSAFLGLAANLVLTILLSPATFGIYITVLSIISLLNYFSDIGLAASLIQKKEIPKDDVKTAFTTQQLLIITVIVIAYFATPFIQSFYKLPPEGIFLYWALLLSFFISSLKTIPSIFLERKIQFQKIVFVQVLENTIFYISVIVLALMGYGLESFTISVVLRAIVGLIAIYSISFWVPQIGISFNSLKNLLSFGLAFQASSFLALFKDDLIILFLGKVLGFEALGYIGWAKKWAEAPIRIVMDNVSRVLFPVISRIQDDKEKVSKLIEKVLTYQTALLAPLLIGLAIGMSELVQLIPKYGKWAPALILFYIFCASAFFSSFSTPFINMFNSLGRVKVAFFFMFIWTLATWILTPLLVNMYGRIGFPITLLILALSSIFVVQKAKAIINLHFLKSTLPYIFCAIIMGVCMYLLLLNLPISFISLGFSILISGGLYLLLLKILYKMNLLLEIKTLFLK